MRLLTGGSALCVAVCPAALLCCSSWAQLPLGSLSFHALCSPLPLPLPWPLLCLAEAETPVVEFVVNDEMVKEVLPSRERIIEVLESVGFDAERQKLPVASLSGETPRWLCDPCDVRPGRSLIVLCPICLARVCRTAAAPSKAPVVTAPPGSYPVSASCRWLEDEAGSGACHADERRHHAPG